MSKYRFYNLSLLPQKVEKKEVGLEGYKKFFEVYKELVDQAHRNKNFAPLAFPLRNEMFFSFSNIYIEDKYAYGTMVKYDQPESIVDLFSGEALASIQRGGSAHRYLFDFVFNFENHIFAVNNKEARLPSPRPFLKSFEFFFSDIAQSSFPDHVLEVGQITSSQAVEDAYNSAEKFKRGEVTVTFSNSTLFEEQIIKEVEAELKEKAIEKTTVIESASPKGLMTDLSNYFKALLGIAKTTTGAGCFRYLDKKTQKLKVFNMKDHPYEKSINKFEKDSSEDLRKRVLDATFQAVEQGTKN